MESFQNHSILVETPVKSKRNFRGTQTRRYESDVIQRCKCGFCLTREHNIAGIGVFKCRLLIVNHIDALCYVFTSFTVD